MQMNIKQIANKALSEPQFLIGLLDGVEYTLKSFNIESISDEVQELKVAMNSCKEFMIAKLVEVGADTREGIQGIGFTCCNT